MDLVAYATPFFVLAIVVEFVYGHMQQRNTYRVNDSISSLSLGVLSQARRFVTLGIGGYVYYLVTAYFSLPLMDSSHWFTWVLAMVLYDFCYYWLHRLGHERTILWAAHVAHHQSEDYNLTTALRQTSTGFLLGWLFYLPMFFVGVPAEVVVTVGSINLIYQYWVHTEHIPKLGWFEWFFVSPSNHRVHHAQNDIYMDKNYGGLFILWDRLFGTFQEELPQEPVIFGIRGPLKSFNPVRALTHVYVDMAKDTWHTRRLSDKLRIWVSRTGWRPDDVALRFPRQKNDLSTFERYNPKIPALVSGYALMQLVAIIALLELMRSSDFSYWAGVALWAWLLGTTVTTALWLEGRASRNVFRWEIVRLAFLFALTLVLSPAVSQWVWVLGYAAASLILLLYMRQLPSESDGEMPA